VQLLERFGEESGLFSTVDAHTFGSDPSAPFEVLVQISGIPLNISNVGYGVSQVLPVVVEMLTRPKGHWFAIQQPEVHLHPRAQAALGELIHFLVTDLGHRYLIETHSDHLVDRFRLRVSKTGKPTDSQVLFFERTAEGNVVFPLNIDSKGRYPYDQPPSFRRFFLDEELSLLEL
jgi:predicted ATPase